MSWLAPVQSIGVIIDKATSSQLLHCLVSSLRTFRESRPRVDVGLFVRSRQGKEAIHGLPILALSYAWSFPGVLVSTCRSTTTVLDNAGRPSPNKRFFFVWDLEWSRRVGSAEEWASLYRNPTRRLLSRGVEHQQILSDCWNLPSKPIAINQNALFDEVWAATYGQTQG